MSKYLLAVGVGVATVTAVGLGVLWWKRRESPPDAESYQTPVAKVAKLCVYPVKSCHSVEVESTECLPRGLKYDRCWAIVTKDGMVPNLHNTASLSRIQPKLETAADGSAILYLTAPDMPELIIREPSRNAPSTTVHLWGVAGEAVDVGDEAGQWASRFLGKEGCRMVYMSPCHRGRYLRDDTNWADVAKAEDQASFADFSPMMIASEESLDLLNSKLDSPIPMDRFRPNIVVTGCDPHAEDNWKEIRIGKSLVLKGIRHCRRCKVTTVETELGYYTGQEPLKTLKTYRCRQHINAERRYEKSALFGYYYTILRPGEINVGDTIYIK